MNPTCARCRGANVSAEVLGFFGGLPIYSETRVRCETCNAVGLRDDWEAIGALPKPIAAVPPVADDEVTP